MLKQSWRILSISAAHSLSLSLYFAKLASSIVVVVVSSQQVNAKSFFIITISFVAFMTDREDRRNKSLF